MDIIWTGETYVDGQTTKARVVRRGDGELFFEYEWALDRMGQSVWHEQKEPFRDFLIYAGNMILAEKLK